MLLGRREAGYIVAHGPALKSCWSKGKTREEASRNIREAVELYLEEDLTFLWPCPMAGLR